MRSFEENDVLIVKTQQAGTVVQVNGKDIWLLLRNNDVWVGPSHDARFPQDQADLDACKVDVERLEVKRTPADRTPDRDRD